MKLDNGQTAWATEDPKGMKDWMRTILTVRFWQSIKFISHKLHHFKKKMSKVHLLFSLYCVPHFTEKTLSLSVTLDLISLSHTLPSSISTWKTFPLRSCGRQRLSKHYRQRCPFLFWHGNWRTSSIVSFGGPLQGNETPLERKLNSFKYAVVVVRIECGVCRLASLWTILYTLYTWREDKGTVKGGIRANTVTHYNPSNGDSA